MKTINTVTPPSTSPCVDTILPKRSQLPLPRADKDVMREMVSTWCSSYRVGQYLTAGAASHNYGGMGFSEGLIYFRNGLLNKVFEHPMHHSPRGNGPCSRYGLGHRIKNTCKSPKI